MDRRNLWLAGVLVAGVAAAGAWQWTLHSKKPIPRFETTKLERGAIQAKVTATGTLSALVTVQVGSQVSGRIQQILVDFNSPVKKGQVLARLDPQLFEASLEQARASFKAAQGSLKKSKVQALDLERQYLRSESLESRKLIAPADVDTAKANMEAAKAQVEVAQGNADQAVAALHQAEVNLAYTTIVSPINGMVISRNVDVGQTVAASLQAPTLFVIAEDLRKVQVDSSVAEADVGKLRPGMKAEFTVDAYPGDRFKGHVRQVRNAPQTVQNVVTYDAVVDVRNPDLKLKPGMTANVTYVYAERGGVLRLPNAALRFRMPDAKGDGRSMRQVRSGANGEPRLEGGRREADMRKVWVLRDGKPQEVKIKVGISDGSLTELVKGELHEGDAIVTDLAGAPSGSRRSGASRPGGGMRF